MKNGYRNGFYLISQFCVALLLCGVFTVEPIVAATGQPSTDPAASGFDPASALTPDQKVMQALSRLTFGARPGDFDRIRQMGVNAYINQQFAPDTIDDSALDKRLEKLPTLMLMTPTIAEQYNPPKPPPPPPSPSPSPSPAAMKADGMEMNQTAMNTTAAPVVQATPAPTPKAAASPTPVPKPTPIPKNPQMVVTELQRAKLLRAVYSERQLNEVVVDFWENHFSIFANKDADRWMMTAFDRESIRPFAMGRFRDLLGATAHSPAMLYYLDNWQSSMLRTVPATKDKPARQYGGINENYARELMELHTMGVDGGYTQKDVQEVARCFTGWTIRKPNEEGTFIFNPQIHDNGEKIVLGQKIAAGGGIADAEHVLDILAKHPSTAKFIATKLARRFIGDDPPAAVIDAAAKVFLQTDGSITETLRTIINSPEFFSPKSFQSKVRSPFEYAAASLRITDADTDANRPILDWIGRMGQPLYGHLTPDGYPDHSNEWLSSNDLLARFNFATALTTNKIAGTKVDPTKLFGTADTSGPAEVVSTLTRLMLMNQIVPKSRNILEKVSREMWKDAEKKPAPPGTRPPAVNAPLTTPVVAKFSPSPPAAAVDRAAYISQMMALTLGTPEFQRK